MSSQCFCLKNIDSFKAMLQCSSVTTLSIIALNIATLCITLLDAECFSIVMFNVIMLNVFMSTTNILNVVKFRIVMPDLIKLRIVLQPIQISVAWVQRPNGLTLVDGRASTFKRGYLD